MFADRHHKEGLNKEGLNKVVKKVLQAARATDEDVQRAVASPFLFAKIQAHIDERKAQAVGSPSPSLLLPLWLVTRRAIVALTVIAILTLSSLLIFGKRATATITTTTVNNEPPGNRLLTATQPNLVTTACSLAAKDECAVSTSDVIAILMTTSEGHTNEGQKK